MSTLGYDNPDSLVDAYDAAQRGAVERDAQAVAGLDPNEVEAMTDRQLLERIHTDQQTIIGFVNAAGDMLAPLAQLAGSGMSPMGMLGALMRGPAT